MAIGATVLGKADYYHVANYLQAFFSLSTGIERSSKLALCLNYLLDNDKYPSNQFLRDYNHSLIVLLSDLDQIGKGFSDPVRLPNTEIHRNIIDILSDFANNMTRYYYLDFLTHDKDIDKSYDPVERWHIDVTQLVLETHLTDRMKRKIIGKAQFVDEVLGSFSLVRYSTEAREPITTSFSASVLSQLTEQAVPYTRMYVLQICRFIASIVIGIENRVQYTQREHIPVMDEIFLIFQSDDQYFKRRKTWSIYRR